MTADGIEARVKFYYTVCEACDHMAALGIEHVRGWMLLRLGEGHLISPAESQRPLCEEPKT